MIERQLYPEKALHGQVAHIIGRRIVSGEIREGDFLPREAELAEEFGISRQAVREALKVLAAKGLVISRRRTGTKVQTRRAWNLLDADVLAWHPLEKLDHEFTTDLIELRRVVEPTAASFAALRATDEQIEAISTALEGMRTSIDDGEAFVRHDVAFHVAVSMASGNSLFDRLSLVVEPLLKTSFMLQVRQHIQAHTLNEVVQRHEAVYSAILSRNADAARDATENLLASAGRTVDSIPWDHYGAANGESHAEP